MGVALLLVGLVAASNVGIAPMDDSKGIMALTIDVQDLPCDEPFDENERVLVEPDTVNGQIRMHVIVRNRDCCCCGADERGKLGLLRGSGQRSTPERRTTPEAAKPEVASVVERLPTEEPLAVAPIERLGPAPLAARSFLPLGAPSAPIAVNSSRAGVPWWIALAAAPAIFLYGRDSGDICEDDETGATSGPSRTC